MSSRNKHAKTEAFNKLLKPGKVTANVVLSLNPEGGLWIMRKGGVGPILFEPRHTLHAICDARHIDHFIRSRSNLMGGRLRTALFRTVYEMMAGVAILPMRLRNRGTLRES